MVYKIAGCTAWMVWFDVSKRNIKCSFIIEFLIGYSLKHPSIRWKFFSDIIVQPDNLL